MSQRKQVIYKDRTVEKSISTEVAHEFVTVVTTERRESFSTGKARVDVGTDTNKTYTLTFNGKVIFSGGVVQLYDIVNVAQSALDAYEEFA